MSTPALELVVAEASRNRHHRRRCSSSARAKRRSPTTSPRTRTWKRRSPTKGDHDGARRRSAGRRALATIHQVEQHEPRGLGDAVAHGEQFADGEPIAVLLPDDLIDDRDDLLGPMLDVYAEHGGIVIGADRRSARSRSASTAASPADGATRSATSWRSPIWSRSPLPTRRRARWRSSAATSCRRRYSPRCAQTEPGASGEIQLTDAMRLLAQDGVPVHGVVFRGRRYDTGDRLDYVQASCSWPARHPDIGAEFTRLVAGVCADDANLPASRTGSGPHRQEYRCG